MKGKKKEQLSLRLNERQLAVLDRMISDGIAQNRSAAMQYLINHKQIMG